MRASLAAARATRQTAAMPAPVPIGRFYPDAGDPQQPADVAVVMPTVIRSIIQKSIESIFAQRFPGRVQLLIGVDKAEGDVALIEAMLDRRDERFSALLLELPYSTGVRHGGCHTPGDGGALRAILSLAANSRYLGFLDDDNLWLPDHLALLTQAIQGKTYAYAQRMLMEDETGRDLGIDRWHSTGPGRGQFARTGGFVDPNCLLVDKVLTAHHLGAWAQTWSGQPGGVAADKRFFAAIAASDHAEVVVPTVRYGIRRDNVLYRLVTTEGA